MQNETLLFKKGDLVGDFEIIQQVSVKSDVSRVYFAKDSSFQQYVCIKQAKSIEDRFENIFLRESTTLESLIDSDAKIPLYLEFLDKGVYGYCIAMRWIKGLNLARLIKFGQMSQHCAAKITIDVCKTIEILHKHNIVHRDIKPSGILMAKSHGKPFPKVPYILDLGNSAKAGVLPSNNLDLLMGTRGCFPVEQSNRNIPVHISNDVYALGNLLFQMIIEIKSKIDSDSTELVLDSEDLYICESDRSQMLNSGRVSSKLAAITKKAIADSADQRYQSVLDFRKALEKFLKE